MKKITKVLLSSMTIFAALMPAVYAVCPVCTVAVGVGLEGARMLGIDDVITGVWAGGLTLSLFFWTVAWLKKKGVNSTLWQMVVPFIAYYALLGCVYMLPSVTYGACTLWGIDKFLLGIIVGTVCFYLGVRWYVKIKRNNGGKAKFPFQKVVMPLSLLMLATVVFLIIIKC